MFERDNLAEEIIKNASELPIDCQEWLLALAKGMNYTKSCIENKSARCEEDSRHVNA